MYRTRVQFSSVAYLNHVDFNPDAAFHGDVNLDSDPTFYLHADPAFHFDVYPLRIQLLTKVMHICNHWAEEPLLRVNCEPPRLQGEPTWLQDEPCCGSMRIQIRSTAVQWSKLLCTWHF